MNRSRFWSIYAAAWIPYSLSYYILFRLLPGHTQPIRQTAYNIIPALLFGTLIVHWSRLLSWRFHRRWWFYPAQLASAVTYSLFWYFGVLLAGSLGQALETHRFALSNFSSYAIQWQFFSGLMIYANIVGVMYVSEVNATLRLEVHRRELAETLRTRAQLSALRAQLNPHFLFNTLNSLMAMAAPGQSKMMEAIAHLASMLRYTLGNDLEEEGVSLRQELAFTDQYLTLESLRLGERLNVIRDLSPEALVCRLPPLTVQPLVENAIRHGIAPRAEGGTLSLRASVREATLHIEVRDDGMGADPTTILHASGLGVQTVRRRLDLYSNGEAKLNVEASPGKGCRISIEIKA